MDYVTFDTHQGDGIRNFSRSFLFRKYFVIMKFVVVYYDKRHQENFNQFLTEFWTLRLEGPIAGAD